MEKRVALLEQRIGQITEAAGGVGGQTLHEVSFVSRQGEGSRIQTLCEQAKRLQEGLGSTVLAAGSGVVAGGDQHCVPKDAMFGCESVRILGLAACRWSRLSVLGLCAGVGTATVLRSLFCTC